MDSKKEKEVNGNFPKDQKSYRYESPLTKSVPNFFSRVLFCWMFPIYYNGMRRDLEENDLVPTKSQYDSKISGDLLEKNWLKEEANAKAAGRPPSLTRALFKTFWISYIPGGLMQFAYTTIRTFTPLLFAQLLMFWAVPEDPENAMTRETAAIYAGAMVLANWVSSFLNHHGNLYCQQIGMKLRIATSSLMFRKIMRMNNSSLGDTAAGKVVNILSNDMQRFDLALMFLHYVWIIPIQLVAVCYLGYLQAGYAALIGLAVLGIIALPIQGAIGHGLGTVRGLTAERTDDRIKVMTEVINGIQVIKMYAWELPFQKVVSEKRAAEMKHVKTATILRTVFMGLMIFTERTALFITILVFVLLGNTMSANVIYPLQQFMNSVQVNITIILPLVLSFTAELIVALKRIQEFLILGERPDLVKRLEAPPTRNLFSKMSPKMEKSEEIVRPISYYNAWDASFIEPNSNRSKSRRSISQPGGDTILEVRDVSASWIGDPEACALKNVSLRLRKGKLCAIIGSVGSGKSTLLQLLLKELPAHSGSVAVHGTMSYASQEAWLFPNTVRENILFGLSFDAEKYKKVCRVCCLEKDFKQFPYGDQTLVGERGVSLSGGQRARINLARSVYREADIYLMDDPLSAVDSNVGRLLFEGCINGYLSGRTRVLVTHQIHFLKAADYIVVLNQGRVENMGTFDELVSSGKEFSMMLSSIQEGKDKDTDSVGSGVSNDDKEKRVLRRDISMTSEGEDIDEFEAQKLQEEERQSGNLKWSVVKSYFKSGGSVYFILFTVCVILLGNFSGGAVDYWVSYWSNNMSAFQEAEGQAPEPGLDVVIGQFTTGQYLIIYGSLILICIAIVHMRVIPYVGLIVNASKNLHNFMFSTMIKGVMRFFDTSSSGRILNRFTKDMGALDEILPRTLLDVVQIYASLFTILVLNAIALYWTIVPSIFLLLIFAYIVRVYMKTAQSIKRLEGTTKSPVFGSITSSLNGIATIRSAGAQNRLIDEFDRHQDLHTAAWNGFLCGGSSFGFYLDTLCIVYLTIVIFIFIYFDFGALVGVGSVGLAVTQTTALTAMLQHGARMLVDFLAQLTSVERVLEYTRIDTEDNLFEGQIKSPPMWPSEGRIVMSGVSMRYAPEEAPVLKDLNVTVESGWKVGIVGRTGAGKSSLISAMFRFAFLEGKITIDGVDTSLVARQELRSKISIIPQEPVLFSATIRYNLDPFDLYSDADIWNALEQVDMKSAVPSLDFKVTEGGSNFSVGQRQLMCLARAVLRSNKILIMDEATANVDPQTDNFIQKTIKHHFASCTVLTIAHRLNTIMDSDRVLVMSFGQAVEYDHPYVLLSDPNSHFSAMVRETGEKTAAQLFQVAKDAYFQSNLKENAR